ncbi:MULTISPECIES: NAD(P)H-dependent oxidoreductase [Pseudomonas]|uniref:NAD(P)H-dependent oxidoreductase n=1 Tax=Pseudomonadaceae TaxID=135621 RepID=UPI000428310F|nr:MULTISPECIES: NAD(P)H-dependent oxidoreductase [Pseudomonas]MDE3738830.1 NAD(P)H-dependent oxidoreductase [Pseudomonas resinovorans]
MHALIVVAHHDPRSLTHSLASQVAAGLGLAGHSAEIGDLAQEGFDPRFNLADHAVHRHQVAPPADVAAEQARIDRSDALVLVFPVYWWSMPGLLKGWIDRVFANGWAFEYSLEGGLTKKLRNLKVHLIGVAGADAGTFERHGYSQAMKTQIDHGIFDYCGARVLTSELFFESESSDPVPHLEAARSIGLRLFEVTPQREMAGVA